MIFVKTKQKLPPSPVIAVSSISLHFNRTLSVVLHGGKDAVLLLLEIWLFDVGFEVLSFSTLAFFKAGPSPSESALLFESFLEGVEFVGESFPSLSVRTKMCEF